MGARQLPKGPTGLGPTLIGVATEDRLVTLKRCAARLGEQCDESVSGRELAVLTAELRQVMKEIDQLAPVESSKADQISQRRAARRAGRAKGRGGAA